VISDISFFLSTVKKKSYRPFYKMLTELTPKPEDQELIPVLVSEYSKPASLRSALPAT